MVKGNVIKKIIDAVVKNEDVDTSLFKITRCMTLDELNNLDVSELSRLHDNLNRDIKREATMYDVDKLAYAIHNSNSTRGVVALNAFTNYECGVCKTVYIYHSSLVPSICKGCSTKIAQNIILNDESLLKDNIEVEWREK